MLVYFRACHGIQAASKLKGLAQDTACLKAKATCPTSAVDKCQGTNRSAMYISWTQAKHTLRLCSVNTALRRIHQTQATLRLQQLKCIFQLTVVTHCMTYSSCMGTRQALPSEDKTCEDIQRQRAKASGAQSVLTSQCCRASIWSPTPRDRSTIDASGT
jgi:hypothetical protein